MEKFNVFCIALSNLKDIYNYNEPYENVVLTGIAALYKICFDQSLRAMKEILEYNGFKESKTDSPRQILKTAYKAGLIKEEKDWLDALASRKNVVHIYNKTVALDIVREVKERYYEMFIILKKEIESN